MGKLVVTAAGYCTQVWDIAGAMGRKILTAPNEFEDFLSTNDWHRWHSWPVMLEVGCLVLMYRVLECLSCVYRYYKSTYCTYIYIYTYNIHIYQYLYICMNICIYIPIWESEKWQKLHLVVTRYFLFKAAHENWHLVAVFMRPWCHKSPKSTSLKHKFGPTRTKFLVNHLIGCE